MCLRLSFPSYLLDQTWLRSFNGIAIGGVYVLIALGLTSVFGNPRNCPFRPRICLHVRRLSDVLFCNGVGLSLVALIVGLVLGVLIELLAYRFVGDVNHINAFIVAFGLAMMV